MLRIMVIQIPKFLFIPFKIFFLPVIIIITLVYGGKAFLDYSKIKQQYLEALRENLHSLSLAKNLAVIPIAGNMAYRERAKKFLLCYCFLLKSNSGMSAEELNIAAQKYIKKRFAVEIDFNADESLDILKEFDIIFANEGRYKVAKIDEALWTIDHIWDELYQAPSADSISL